MQARMRHVRMKAREGASVGLAEERAGDDEALDLLRALVQLGDLGVAHHPLDGVVVGVAVAPEDLHGVGGHGHRGVAPDQVGYGRPAGRVRRPRLDLGARLVRELSSGLGAGIHVGEHRLAHLELADPLAELLALPGVLRRHVQVALGDADRLRSVAVSVAIQCRHSQLSAWAYYATTLY